MLGNTLPFKDDRQQKRNDATPEVRFSARFLKKTFGELAEREQRGMAKLRTTATREL